MAGTVDTTEPYYCECGCGRLAPIAKSNHTKDKVVKGQPYRFCRGHSRSKSNVDYIAEDRGHTTPCWIWQRAMANGSGYGARFVNRVYICRAHVWMYEQRFGPVPDGLVLDHLCRVPACVNPDHLEAVTNAENVRRGAKTTLTWPDVHAIRASSLTNAELAVVYGISRTSVSQVRRGLRWAA